GAVDVMAKPDRALQEVGDEFALQLVDKVKAAARAHLRWPRRPPAHLAVSLPPPLAGPRPAPVRGRLGVREPVILLGASTGGCEALNAILSGFPEDAPPVVCVQHIP